MYRKQNHWIMRELSEAIHVAKRSLVMIQAFYSEGEEPKNFQNSISSAEPQKPVNCMQHKAGGCLVLKCSILRQVKDLGHP